MGDVVRLQSLFGDRLPQSELVGTTLACLPGPLRPLSASAQDDNCTVLGTGDLSQMVFLSTELNLIAFQEQFVNANRV